MNLSIREDNLTDGQVERLLTEHLKDMYATSPAESVHALDIVELSHAAISFWVAENEGRVLGCIAIKEHNEQLGEIKSMRTDNSARKLGVANRLLSHIMGVAKQRGYLYLKLETGSMDFFEPARLLYKKHGFEFCEPFADYREDPNSMFMSFALNC